MLGPARLTVLPFLLCFCLPTKMETTAQPSGGAGRGSGGPALADSEGVGIGMAGTCGAPAAGQARLEVLRHVKPSDLPSTPQQG